MHSNKKINCSKQTLSAKQSKPEKLESRENFIVAEKSVNPVFNIKNTTQINTTKSVDVALLHVDTWLLTTLGSHHASLKKKHFWSEKYTMGGCKNKNQKNGIKTIGMVLGYDYYIEGQKTPVVTVRVDFDPIQENKKGKHINIDMALPRQIVNDKKINKSGLLEENSKFCYCFGDHEVDFNQIEEKIYSEIKVSSGERDIYFHNVAYTKKLLAQQDGHEMELSTAAFYNRQLELFINNEVNVYPFSEELNDQNGLYYAVSKLAKHVESNANGAVKPITQRVVEPVTVAVEPLVVKRVVDEPNPVNKVKRKTDNKHVESVKSTQSHHQLARFGMFAVLGVGAVIAVGSTMYHQLYSNN